MIYNIKRMILRRKINTICDYLIENNWGEIELCIHISDENSEDDNICIEVGSRKISQDVIDGMRKIGFIYDGNENLFICYIANIHDMGLFA